MRFIKVADYAAMSRLAADILAAQVILKPDCVLGLATGSTPVGAYDGLIAKCKAGELDFSKVTTVNLDEYRGLPETNDQSYRYFMNDHLFNHVNIDKKNTFVPSGTAADAAAECAAYDARIAALGGIDMQLLGIGDNGHIGFNEPDDAFTGPTHVVDLTESTIQANSRFFEDASQVPTQACTMGMYSIMQAKRILLVAGANKKDIIEKAVYGPITPQVPASILQLHPDVTIILAEN